MPATAEARKDRRYPRITTPTGIWVSWKTGARHGVSPIRTVGLGGMFIFEDDPLPEGTALQLVFQIPGVKGSNATVHARAAVRLAEVGRGMGVEFIQMAPPERLRLAQLMKKLIN
jgi:PilZ domain-containing protein